MNELTPKLFILFSLFVCFFTLNQFLLVYLSKFESYFPNDIKGPERIRIATYNVWNYMWHWPVRKNAICDMIINFQIDVIGLQELRGMGKDNQLEELKEILTNWGYNYYHYEKASEVTYGEGTEEGIGIISKLPIIHVESMSFTKDQSIDTNSRKAIHVVLLQGSTKIDVYVAHFSYNKNQQCLNAFQLAKYIEETAVSPKRIVLGDFNSYKDYEWAVDILLGKSKKNSPCSKFGNIDYNDTLVDVWRELRPEENGYTFSNMPREGLYCRPDRILVSPQNSRLIASEIFIEGDGKQYEIDYFYDVYVSRAYIATCRIFPKFPTFVDSYHTLKKLIIIAVGTLVAFCVFSVIFLRDVIIRSYKSMPPPIRFLIVLWGVSWLIFFYLATPLTVIVQELLDPANSDVLDEAFMHGNVDFFPSDHRLVIAELINM